jgi:competence protein ComEC
MKRRKLLTWLIFPLLIAVILVWVAAFTTTDEKLHVFFLDVGHGDAILISWGECQVLIDGGPSPGAITSELGERLPYWDHTIELMVLTHPHEDHLAGLVEVLRRYEVKRVLEYDAQRIEGFHSSAYEEWLKLIEEKNIERTIAEAGQRIDLGAGVWIEVLHPPATLLQGTDCDVDNNGVVLRLVYGEVSFLLTADIHEEAERYLLRQGFELQSTVLKVAHHGSNTSTSEEFLTVVNLQLAIISVGEEYDLPDEEVVERLSHKVYLTSERGTIELITDGQGLWLKAER